MIRVDQKTWQACVLMLSSVLLFSCGQPGNESSPKTDNREPDEKNTATESASKLKKGESEGSARTEQSNKEQSTKEQVIKVVNVKKELLHETLTLPGELRAYQDVPIHAKVEGYISWIGVDRGSVLKKGDKMITIYCPELIEKLKEAEAKVSSAVSSYESSKSALENEINKQVALKASLLANKLTYERLNEAAKTPGAIAQNEVDIAFQTMEADKARLAAQQSSVAAARSVVKANADNIAADRNVVKAMEAMKSYLTITAPFDGVITERNVHTGSIVSVDATRKGDPLVRIQEKDLLRLVVPVPEEATGGIESGQTISFTVPAYIGKTFSGKVARLGFALDSATRTMPVELNAWNPTGELEPGMFATVQWKANRTYETLFVPAAAVGADLKGTYVNKIENGVLKRLKAKRGQPMGDLVEILSSGLEAGDAVALRATDEIESGTKVATAMADESDIQASKKTTQAGGE